MVCRMHSPQETNTDPAGREIAVPCSETSPCLAVKMKKISLLIQGSPVRAGRCVNKHNDGDGYCHSAVALKKRCGMKAQCEFSWR